MSSEKYHFKAQSFFFFFSWNQQSTIPEPRVMQWAYFIQTPAPEDGGGGPLFYAVSKGVKLGFKPQSPKASRCLHLMQVLNQCSKAGDEVVH